MSLHPEYPVVSGNYRLTSEWEVDLPIEFNRRLEDADLVLWRPSLTFWIAVWGNDSCASTENRLQGILQRAHPNRQAEQIEHASGVVRLTYELPEEDDSRAETHYTSISGYVLSAAGGLQISAYFDTAQARSVGYQVIHSVRYVA